MKAMRHWQDPVNALLGVWLVLSPWMLDFADERTALLDFVAVGVLLTATAIGAIVVPQAWEEWVEVVLGLWFTASPWLLGFEGHLEAMQNAVFSGLVVTVLALWVLVSDDALGGWLRRRAKP
jgi:hypothetical protein